VEKASLGPAGPGGPLGPGGPTSFQDRKVSVDLQAGVAFTKMLPGRILLVASFEQAWKTSAAPAGPARPVTPTSNPAKARHIVRIIELPSLRPKTEVTAEPTSQARKMKSCTASSA
jgi:hypothetical protein